MTDELTRLVEAAKLRTFSEEERQAQRRSFAYGNAKIENDRVTWEMIVEADEQIKPGSQSKHGYCIYKLTIIFLPDTSLRVAPCVHR